MVIEASERLTRRLHPGEHVNNTPDAQTPEATILATFTAKEAQRYCNPIWSAADVARYSELPASVVRKALPGMVEAGQLAAMREDGRIDKSSIAWGTHGSRPGATYYMLPARYEDLVRQRDERVREPYLQQAQRIVLDRHADEVTAEFERLWAARQK